jgi:Fe-S-cluster-containing hydrogenase component 2
MPAVVNRDECDACARRERQECIFVCPYDAIRLTDGKALVDSGKCDDCKMCIDACPVKAIGFV